MDDEDTDDQGGEEPEDTGEVTTAAEDDDNLTLDDTDPHDDDTNLEDGLDDGDNDEPSDNNTEDTGDNGADPHDDDSNLEDGVDDGGEESNTQSGNVPSPGTSSGGGSSDPHDDDSNLEDGVDSGDDSGDNSSEDTGEESGEENGTPEQTADELKEIEARIFDSLSENGKKNKILNLKNQYLDLYKSLEDIEFKISRIQKNDDNIHIFNRLTKTIVDLKDYVNYHIINNFSENSYFDNLSMFYKYVAVLNGVKNVLKDMNKEREKGEK